MSRGEVIAERQLIAPMCTVENSDRCVDVFGPACWRSRRRSPALRRAGRVPWRSRHGERAKSAAGAALASLVAETGASEKAALVNNLPLRLARLSLSADVRRLRFIVYNWKPPW